MTSSEKINLDLSFDDLIRNHGSASVLAVDDNQKNIQVIGQLLKKAPWCSLSVCLESNKAIKMATKLLPDIILLDLHMPNLSGIEVLKKLNKLEILKSSTVIFLTADREIENRLEGLSLGCADYIQKPFNGEEFIIKLKYHIKMRFYEKEILNALKKTNNLLDNINQAIFSINKDGEIIRPISKYSSEIFGSSVGPGHNIKEFFTDKFQFSREEINSITKRLLSSFNQSKINWTKIENDLPKKYIFSNNGEDKKILQIKYSSVWKNEDLENIIFYFYDITNEEQKEDDSTKYSLSQISSLSGINLETLRSWTKRFSIKGKFYETYWNCLCDCGKETVKRGSTLRSGATKSCGQDCVYSPTRNDWKKYKDLESKSSWTMQFTEKEQPKLVSEKAPWKCDQCGEVELNSYQKIYNSSFSIMIFF